MTEVRDAPPVHEPMVSTAQLSSELQVSPETVRKLADSGVIPFSRIGRQRRYDAAEVRRALRLLTPQGPLAVSADPQ